MKILIVDDAKSVVQVMALRLSSYGHKVMTAENGEVAIEKFQKFSPDLILMDIEMPVLNGFKAAKRIRDIEAENECAWTWTPIIFLTSSSSDTNLTSAIEAGGDDFISKNVSEPVLHAKMKAMTRIATLRQKLSVANQKLEEAANQDGLTGLCNRRSMDARIDKIWSESKEHSHSFGLLMLDIDNFKKYNDHYGHQDGDECLRSVALSIAIAVDNLNASGVTKDAFPARYGGEEFTVVVPNATVESLEKTCSEIVKSVRELKIRHEKNANIGIVTLSIGATRVEKPSGKIGFVFRAADEQLYIVKENGRNGFQITATEEETLHEKK